MSSVVYYYSATGNCLDLSRRLAEAIDGTRLAPLAKFRNQAVKPEGSSRVGFVFPVYAWGPPRSVEEFFTRIDLRDAGYVYAVACCGGTACNTLPSVDRLLRSRGRGLDAGFIVRAPGYVDVDPEDTQAGLIEFVRHRSGPVARPVDERFVEIVQAVQETRKSPPEHGAWFGSAVGGFLHRASLGQMRKLDSRYRVSEACDGCGLCARICPRENIRLEGQRPLWNHDCDACGACATWCPNHAITQNTAVAAAGRHHERVKLGDMLLRA